MAKASKKGGELVTPETRHPLRRLEEIERWLDEGFPWPFRRMQRWGWPSWGELGRPLEAVSPRVDVIDRDDEVLVRAEIPGVKKEDLDVSVTESSVTIKGRTEHQEREEKDDYYRCEIARGAFARTIALPAGVDTEKVEASFKDGLLELKLAKIAEAKRRSIKVE